MDDVTNVPGVGSKAHVKMAFKAYRDAAARAEKADHDLRERKRKALDAFEREFEREPGTIGLRTALLALQKERARAEEEWNAAKVAATLAKDEGIPVGTKVIEWGRKRSPYYSSKPKPIQPTGRVGRIEVWTSASIHPINERWGHPRIGDKYVRLIKKDGTDSQRYEKLSGWGGEWLPEGATPREATKK